MEHGNEVDTCTQFYSQMKDAQLIEISNDRTDTYLQAIRSQIVPSLQLVVIVFPTSRDDRSVTKLIGEGMGALEITHCVQLPQVLRSQEALLCGETSSISGLGIQKTVPVPCHCSVSIPGHQFQDHLGPAEAAKCHTEDSPPDQL